MVTEQKTFHNCEFEESNRAGNGVYEIKGLDKPARILDTQEIMDVYMQRPKCLYSMSLGLWFAAANCLNDKVLRGFGIFHLQTRRYLIEMKYTHLPIESLQAYNKAWEDKKNK